MLSKLERARALGPWLTSLHSAAATYELPAKSDDTHTKVLVGNMLSRLNLDRRAKEPRDVEFQVFSQFGDDGFIRYLMHALPLRERTFIEFGVENYTEANSRFVLANGNWTCLEIDGDQNNIEYIIHEMVSRLFDLRAKQAFIKRDNINGLILDVGFSGKIGILSVDIDGMDYCSWHAISVIDPAVAIAEYKVTFGPDRTITVPYQPHFVCSKAHASPQYWRVSLVALHDLVSAKGYTFYACNANGNNAYFVRNDLAGGPCIANLDRCFHVANFAEYAVNSERLHGQAVYQVVKGLPVFDTRTGQVEPL